jgi:hypothetical protein
MALPACQTSVPVLQPHQHRQVACLRLPELVAAG